MNIGQGTVLCPRFFYTKSSPYPINIFNVKNIYFKGFLRYSRTRHRAVTCLTLIGLAIKSSLYFTWNIRLFFIYNFGKV